MADNWAHFPSGGAEGGTPGNNQVGEDDDWDEFGGFEGASPAPPELSQQLPGSGVEASPSPWAAFSMGGASQPDLLIAQSLLAQAQLAPQPALDPPFADPVPKGPPPELASQAEASVQAQQQAQPNGGDAAAAASIEGAPFNEPRERPLVQVPSGLDGIDISWDDEEDVLCSGSSHQSLNIALPHENGRISESEAAAALDGPHGAPAPMPQVPEGLPEGLGLLEDGGMTQSGVVDLTQMEESLSVAGREKLRLQRDKEELQKKVDALEREVEGHRVEAEQQQARYNDMQARHRAEIEEIRRVGHEALAVIIEEYKELCKCAVAKQQEASEQQLQLAITREVEHCQELMQEQHARFTSALEEERTKSERKLDESLQEQLETQRMRIAEYLQEERDRSRNDANRLLKDVEAERRTAMQSVLEEEAAKCTKLIEEQMQDARRRLEDDQKRHNETLERALEEERQKSREWLRKALEEERVQHHQETKRAVERAREATITFCREQQRADLVVRQRSLATMDLFIESTRQQLKVLLEQRVLERSINHPSSTTTTSSSSDLPLSLLTPVSDTVRVGVDGVVNDGRGDSTS